MKLIVTNSLPTSLLFGNLLQLSVIESSGIEIEFWDLAPLHFDKDILNQYFSGAANYEFIGPKHKKFESHSSLAIAISENRNAIYWHLSRFGRVIRDEAVMALFARFDIKYFFQHIDVHDDIYNLTQLPRFIVREARQKVLNWSYNPLGVVTSGLLGRRQVNIRYPSTSVIDVRTPKVLWKRTSREIAEPYVVFVDESLVHDPDTKLHGTHLVTDVDAYYRRMRQSFDTVEQTLGYPVIIACSGKFEYVDPDLFFGKRQVIYRRTKELIDHSEFVIGHVSLALDQAVVSYKPVLILDDPDFTSYRRFGFRDVIKRFRSRPILNSDIKAASILECLTRDRSFYRSVIKRYFRYSLESQDIGEAVAGFIHYLQKMH